MHRKIKILILSAIIILPLSLFFYLNRTPQNPSSAEEKEDGTILEQKNLFQDYTRYIRDNHGGLLVAEETHASTIQKDDVEIPSVFLHRYRFFDKTLIFNLTQYFSKQESLTYRVETIQQDKDPQLHDRYKIVFEREGSTLFSVVVETTGSIVKHYEEPAMKDSISAEPVESEKSLSEWEGTSYPGDVKGRLAIIIDDLGYRMGVFKKLVGLNYDLTFSILPNLENTEQTIEILSGKQFEVLLHLPMQPKDWPKIDPGPGALMIDNDREVLISKVEDNISSVRYAVGVNNHMGSAFTLYQDGLEVTMEVLKRHNLFFIDSKTAPGNTARNAAVLHKVPYLSRSIFLDNDEDQSKIEIQLKKAARIAKKYGRAIAIGHPYLSTFRALANRLPDIEKQGVQIVFVSKLIDQKSPDG